MIASFAVDTNSLSCRKKNHGSGRARPNRASLTVCRRWECALCAKNQDIRAKQSLERAALILSICQLGIKPVDGYLLVT